MSEQVSKNDPFLLLNLQQLGVTCELTAVKLRIASWCSRRLTLAVTYPRDDPLGFKANVLCSLSFALSLP